MSNNDQHLVDHLYNTIFIQQLRCNHFNSVGQLSSNSIWNKHSDEKQILDKMVEKYKNYYKTKIDILRYQLNDLKEANVNSYLTYDTEYHINEYNKRIKEINKYIIELDAKTLDHFSKDKLSVVSEAIDQQFPGYLVDPTLLGQLC
jgi:hypothetical protein